MKRRQAIELLGLGPVPVALPQVTLAQGLPFRTGSAFPKGAIIRTLLKD
jgi:hypothetical protein